MGAGSRDIPLSTLPRSTNQAPNSSTTGIQAQQCPSISNVSPALPSPQSALAQSPLPSITTLPPAPTSGPPSTVVLPSRRYQRWYHAVTKRCSSARIGAVVALIALGVGGYYYYGQYIISWKTWEVGIWKDCRDRADIANSSVCHRYANISYDQIARRTDNRSYVAPTTNSMWMEMTFKGSFLLLVWLIMSTASVAVAYDNRYGGSRNNLSQNVYAVSIAAIMSLVSALVSPYEALFLLCAIYFQSLPQYSSTFQEIYPTVSHTPSRKLQSKRNLLWGIISHPIWDTIERVLSPAACLLFVYYAFRLFVLHIDFQNMSDLAHATLYVTLAAIIVVLSFNQSIIPQTGMKVNFDYEAQFHCVVGVSRGILSFREKKNQ